MPIDATIYILGPGNIGQLIAHSLAASTSPPPLKLLFHRDSLDSAWVAAGRNIRLRRNNFIDERSAIQAERVDENQSALRLEDELRGPIAHLIVTAKCTGTLSLLSRVRHRLNSGSTILFLQNGMGIIDEISTKLFPDENSRPHYLQGIVSHGVLQEGPFKIHHTGDGRVVVGLPSTTTTTMNPGSPSVVPELPPSTRHLLQSLTDAPSLNASTVSAVDFFQAQLEKLAINAAINPLTALLECRNGDIRQSPSLEALIDRILAEASMVFRALPELVSTPNVEERFSVKRLSGLVHSIATSTASNESSMLRDIRLASPSTEIDYITGYIVRKGAELGVDCSTNYSILQILQAKASFVHLREQSHRP